MTKLRLLLVWLPLLLATTACDPLTGDLIHVRRIRKSARAAIPVFEAPTAPYEAVINPLTMRDLAVRYGAPISDPTCHDALVTAVQTCATHCSLDALDTALSASCGGISLADGQSDVGGPRLLHWLADTVSDVAHLAGSVDPYAGYVDVDVTPIRTQGVDYAQLDAEIDRVLLHTPLTMHMIRRYHDDTEVLGGDAARIGRVLALPELRSVSVIEIGVRTLTPDELLGTVTDSQLLEPTTYGPCVAGQDRFPAARTIAVHIARDLPPLVDGSIPSCDAGAACDAGVPSFTDTLIDVDRGAGVGESCAVIAPAHSSVNVAGYLTGTSHELELRIDATTPLPFRPAIVELCTDGSGLPCPRAATVPVGGYVRFLITLQNLSEHSLQRFIDAVEEPRDM